MHLYIIRGIPGSGKTTLAKKLLSSGVVSKHFEADMFMLNKQGNYEFNPKKLKDCHNNCFDKVKYALCSGVSVVVSNTFTRHWEYLPYVDLAEELGCDYTMLVCQGNFENEHGVPAEVVSSMKSRFEF